MTARKMCLKASCPRVAARPLNHDLHAKRDRVGHDGKQLPNLPAAACPSNHDLLARRHRSVLDVGRIIKARLHECKHALKFCRHHRANCTFSYSSKSDMNVLLKLVMQPLRHGRYFGNSCRVRIIPLLVFALHFAPALMWQTERVTQCHSNHVSLQFAACLLASIRDVTESAKALGALQAWLDTTSGTVPKQSPRWAAKFAV